MKKRCAKCGEEKELEDFARHTRHADGRSSRCKKCDAAQASIYRAAHHEQVLDSLRNNYRRNRDSRMKAMREYHEMHKDEQNAAMREWRAEHREEQNAKSRAFYTEHRDEMVKKATSYRKEHSEQVSKAKKIRTKRLQQEKPQVYRLRRSIDNARRRASKSLVTGRHTAADRLAIYKEQGGCCLYCGVSVPAINLGNIDHLTPLVRGGSDGPENLAFTCGHCNRKKWSRTHEEFLERLGAKAPAIPLPRLAAASRLLRRLDASVSDTSQSCSEHPASDET